MCYSSEQWFPREPARCFLRWHEDNHEIVRRIPGSRSGRIRHTLGVRPSAETDGTAGHPAALSGRAVAVNQSGQILGESDFAVIWKNGQVFQLGDGRRSVGINDRGQAATFRWKSPAYYELTAEIYSGGATTELLPGNNGTVLPGSINNRGEVAVLYTTAGGNLTDRIGVWRNGKLTELVPPAGSGPFIMGGLLNDRGQVAAAHIPMSGGESFAFRCTSGTCARLPSPTWATGPVVVTGMDEFGRVTDLGTLGGNYSSASAVNDRGDVVGESRTADGQIHAFLWRGGRMTDLGTLGGDRSSAAAVYNLGKIVGYSTTPDGTTRPVSWN